MRNSSCILLLLLTPAIVHGQGDSLVVGIQDIAWSPDSRSIFFSAMRHKPDWADFAPHKWSVYRYDLRENTTVMVVDSALTVAVAPTGDPIAVGKLVGKQRHLHLADLDGRNELAITTDGDDFAPSWSSDGRTLIFNRRIDGRPEVCAVDADGAGFRQITFSGEHKAYNPVFSPDGRSIVYYLEKGDGRDQIHVMRADGGNDRNVTNDTLNNYYPAWLDARTILYTQDRKNGPAMAFRVDAEGRDKAPMAAIHSFFTRVSPDRNMIAFVDKEAGGIAIITRDSGSRVAFIRP